MFAACADGDARPDSVQSIQLKATSVPNGFSFQTVLSGLELPTMVRFSPDGRVFVSEKSGRVKVFDSLTDTSPTLLIDLSTQVYDYWDRGLLGMALHPSFPTQPYLYLLYATDIVPYGDTCPDPPGATNDGCMANAALVRITVGTDNTVLETRDLLRGNWCQQFPSHSIGSLEFGADGALYVSAGDGASFNFADYGQAGGGPKSPTPLNPCNDPPLEGGALRSQDLQTTSASDPVTFDGAILRIDPLSGEPLPGNPLLGGDARDDRIVAYGLRNPFRVTTRPDTSELWIGDVGWDTWEEINRVPDPTAFPIRNFGWPCYEGTGRNPSYDSADLPICENLYSTTRAVTPPHFTYQHGVPLESCPETPGSTSAISGLAFYAGGNYPVSYQGGLFFADFARACVWVMLPGTDGLPSPSNISLFAKNEPAVALVRGPDGDIFTVDHNGGTIRRIVFAGAGNAPPTAVAQATPTRGSAPLAVTFDGRSSFDPDGDTLSYSWDLDGDGQLDDAFTSMASFTYSTPGTYVATLGVSDGRGGTATNSVTIAVANDAPSATIITPAVGTTWGVGDTINFSGQGTDPQQDPFPTSSMRWVLDLRHCSPDQPTDCHTHRLQEFVGVPSGSFVTPDHEYPSHLDLTLTVRDALGLSDSETLSLYPRTIDLFFDTQPPGLALVVGSAQKNAPFTRTFIEDAMTSIAAPTPQSFGGATYDFESWSDRGTRLHTITASAVGPLAATFDGRPVAVATATPSSGQVPLTVSFSAAGSSDPDSDSLSYAWDLDGDGQFDDATGITASWTYSVAGTHIASVRVTDGRVGVAIATATVAVSEAPANTPPVAALDASPTSGLAPLTVNFSAGRSFDADGDALTYSWDLDGDGVFGDAAGVSPTWTYSNPGARLVTLRVSDGRAGTSAATAKIRVRGGGSH